MDLIRTSAILMIIGFSLIIIGAVIGPPGVYQKPELADRLKIIDKHQGRWKATNIISALGILFTSTGFLVISISIWKSQNQTLLFLGAAGAVISGLAISIESYLRAIDPATRLSSNSAMFAIGLGAFIVAIFLFGFIFLQAGYPAWLGYLMIGAALVLGAGAIFIDFFIGELILLIPFIAAIVILRQR